MNKLRIVLTSSEAYDNADTAVIDSLIEKYGAFMEMILAWNENVNLTAITDRNEFVIKHFIDSLSVTYSEEYINSGRIIDIGTGGGFPGIPLAIFSPEKNFVLVDSLKKRIKIIEECAEKLNINNVRAVHGRAETLGKLPEYRERFDMCVSRAVSRMSVLSEYCIPFVRKGGCFAAYKSSGAESEIREAEYAISTLGGRIERIDNMESIGIYAETADAVRGISGMGHILVYVNKYKHTPEKYPRREGVPERDPLNRA